MRRDVEFSSSGIVCRGWLYRPDSVPVAKRLPCIVLAHGFGAVKEARLDAFADRFEKAGWAALVFDYRHFGASDGEPRQLLDVSRQLDDWAAAIAFARAADGIDAERIALWGSSFSGGHVIVAGARDGRVRAISSQCPMVDGRASSLELIRSAGILHALALGAHGALDLGRAAVGLSPHMIPIIGAPGTVAAMSTADSEPGYRGIMPTGFRNEVAARIGLKLGSYRPTTSASQVPCPILFQICEKDSVAPAAAAEEAARRAGNRAEVIHYPLGHFDVYVGEPFERSVSDQISFFQKNLAG